MLPSAASHADRLLNKARDVKKNLENNFFIREKREYCYSIKKFNTAWIFYKLFCRECSNHNLFLNSPALTQYM